MREYIILNNTNSNTIPGLLISSLPSISKPLIRTSIEEIDGKDGDIVTKLGYAAYDKSFDIGLYGNYDINQIIAYFNSEGTVIFSNEPNKYYKYQILEQIDFEKLIRYKTATVTMHVQPFKYLVDEEPIENEVDLITGEGTDITLNNTVELPFSSFEVKGNTEQATRTGKNFFDISKVVSNWDNSTEKGLKNNGTTLTVASDTNLNFVIAATPNKLSDYCPNLQVGDEVYLTAVVTGNASGIVLGGGTQWTFGTKRTISQNDLDGSVYWFAGGFNKTSTLSEIMISTSGGDYEEYGVMPSPDYPSEIKNVEGKNKLESTLSNIKSRNTLGTWNGNVYTYNGVTFTINEDFSVTIGGSFSSRAYFYISNNKFDIEKNSYILSGCPSGGSSSTYDIACDIFDGTSVQSTVKDVGQGLLIDTTNLTSPKLDLYIDIRSSSAIGKTFYPMIRNAETTNGNYVPYNTVQIKVQNANIWDEQWELGGLSSLGVPTNETDRIRSKNFIPVKPNDLIYCKSPDTMGVRYYDINQNFVSSVNGTNTIITIPSNVYYMKFMVLNTTTYANNICINISNASINGIYISHQEQIVNFPLREGQVLHEGDYLADDGVHSVRNTKVLDGTENWGRSSNGAYYLTVPDWNYDRSGKIICTSSHFMGSVNTSGTSSVPDNKIAFYTGFTSSIKEFYCAYRDVATLEDFKTWLSTHNVTVEYELANSTTTPYTTEQQTAWEQIKALHSYKNVTYIDSSNEPSPIFTISVYGDSTTTIVNAGNIEAKPTITIYGIGDIGVYLNSQQLFQIALGDEEIISIDTANMEAYNPETGALKNRLVTGDYDKFVLNVGSNTLSFSGIVSKVEVSNYSRWL